MSILTSGYFIAPNGDLIRIREHIDAVTADPERYGLTSRDPDVAAAKRNDSAARERVLTAIARRGFVRVRGHRSYITFEGYDLGAEAVRRIRSAIRELEIHPEETILVNDLRDGRSYRGEAAKYGAEEAPVAAWRSRQRSDFIEPLQGLWRRARAGLGSFLRRSR